MGITRDTVLTLAEEAGLTIKETLLPRAMVYTADEIFLSGTAVEINWVRSVDKLVVGNGKMGEITKNLKARMDAVVKDGEDKHGWLTFF
jgi:branched-chain amino acid aminotransferase